MRFLALVSAAAIAAAASAQETTTTTTTTTTVVTNITKSVVEDVRVETQSAPRKAALFVVNRARVPGMDEEVDGVRDRLAAAIAATDAVAVMDTADVDSSFRRWKVTTEEERRGLVDGILSGGSATRVAQMLGCDYLVVGTIVRADAISRMQGGRASKVFTLRMTLKVLDSSGASVFSMPPWTRQLPILDAEGDPLSFYNMLFDQWSEEAGTAVANSAPRWRAPAAVAEPVEFSVTTTIDGVVEALESQTKGVQGELLQELRKVVGGATVEIDGAVAGSAPGQFLATPGTHDFVVRREWMKPFKGKLAVSKGVRLNVALEMSDEGIAKWGTLEKLRADVARSYAEAAWRRGIKVNVDTQNWRDVGDGPARLTIENVDGN